ncbi:MAG TPA: nucleotide pyrophosphohydrolase [Methylomirabilota bacterium]|nr:nucleotide pyrophosphohydrolase [Methylomirabilota bacterium]
MSDSQERNENVSLRQLQKAVREFAAIRNWTRFHNPKNVAEAIVVEAAELLECFQWRTDDSCLSQSLDDTTRLAIESELADVVIYGLNLANALDVDATEVVQAKLEKNATRYPAPFARE